MIAGTSVTRFLVPSPCSREKATRGTSGFKNPHTCSAHSLMLRCLLEDSVPGEAVTPIQSNEGERQDSVWIISGEVVLTWGEGIQRPRNLPDTLTHTYK